MHHDSQEHSDHKKNQWWNKKNNNWSEWKLPQSLDRKISLNFWWITWWGSCNLYTKKSTSHEEFICLGAKAWNILPQTLKASETMKSFSSAFKNTVMEIVKNDEHYHINNFFWWILSDIWTFQIRHLASQSTSWHE